MGWTTGVQLLAGAMMELYLFTVTSRQPLGHTQPPLQCIPEVLAPGIKQ